MYHRCILATWDTHIVSSPFVTLVTTLVQYLCCHLVFRSIPVRSFGADRQTAEDRAEDGGTQMARNHDRHTPITTHNYVAQRSYASMLEERSPEARLRTVRSSHDVTREVQQLESKFLPLNIFKLRVSDHFMKIHSGCCATSC